MARRAGDYGVSFDGKVKVDMKVVKKRRDDIVDSFRGGSERRLKESGVDVWMGEARFTGVKEVVVKMREGGEEKGAKAGWVFVNTGERPATPVLDGLEDVMKSAPERVLDSTSVQGLDIVPEGMIVLGGGYVGLEFAQLFQRLGSKVVVVQRGKQLLPREDPEVVEELRKILVDEGLDIYLEAGATKIETDGGKGIKLDIKTADGKAQTLEGSHILLATGRRPNSDMLNLDATGLKPDKRGHIPVNPDLSTSVPGIFVMGDAKPGPSFTHVSYDDFRIVRDNLDLLPNPGSSPNDKPPKPHTTEARERILPYVVYTDPQLGHVGLHLRDISQSELQSRKIQTAKMPMAYVARALETNESKGLMKAVVDGESGEILGFSCLGIEGGEIMSAVQMAMMGGVKWWELREAVWAHPTLMESLNNLWGFLEDVKA